MWGIGINWDHVRVWQGWLISWLVFVGVALVLGWRLGPRPDEVAVAVFLPLLVLIPYVLGCLLLAVLRLSLARLLSSRYVLRAVQVAKQRIAGRP